MTVEGQRTKDLQGKDFSAFPVRTRSVVYGTKGIVSTTSPLATEVGLRILRSGGNAAVRRWRP
jgi:gamma-glutamyltranspeptidase/glutathione hydrolase